MLSLYVSVPIACFRPGAAREFWETHPLPPPSTVYGFLLSMVGEVDRERHLGARCTAGLLASPEYNTVVRKMWRIKELGKEGFDWAGKGSNVRPDYQQLLTDVQLAIFIDSTDELSTDDRIEDRLALALDPARRGMIDRFGSLSLGESTHMVDQVCLLSRIEESKRSQAKVFVVDDQGNLTLPVWVDHVGGAGTRYATGRIRSLSSLEPSREQIPRIDNGQLTHLE